MADGRLTALQAALAGIGGGVTSAQKYGETRRLEAERKRMFDEERARQARLDERQRELDRIGMLDKGYMTPEEAGAERGAGGAALSRALASASGMLAGRGAPAFGQGIGAGDGTAIVRGMGQVGPQQRATLGGQTFVRAEPESARMRAQELAAGRERMGEERKQAQARTEKEAETAARSQRLSAAFPGINKARLAAVAAGDVDLKDVLPPKPERAPRTGPTEEELDQAEGIFNTRDMDPKLARSMTATFNRLRVAYPTAPPRRLIYQAVQGAMRGMKATQEMQPRGQGGSDQVVADYMQSMGIGTGATAAAQAPTSTPSAPASPDAWMDANPQRDNETDAAYEARYNAWLAGRR